MTRHRPSPPRGVTLLELLVALAVSSIVVVAASSLLIAQQRAQVQGSGQRALQETARVALAEIGRTLRTAGYGVDPAMTFDFGQMDNVPRSTLFTAGVGFIPGYQCNAPVLCRDRIDGPDEVVFYSRDMLFSRPVSGVTAGVVTLRGSLREPLLAGQVLQILCLNDPRTVAYVTVAAYVGAPTIQDPNAVVRVPLAAGSSGGALNVPAFPFENSELASACFSTGVANVVATKIDRFRYYVDTYDEAGNRVAAESPGSRPYLMLDQGLFDQNGMPVLSPVAPDVEDLQLSYLYAPLAAGAGSRRLGGTVGTDLAADGVTVAVAPPAIGEAPDAPSRRTGNPTNILGVRIGVVVRTPEPDATRLGPLDRIVPASGNRPDLQGLPMYRRALFENTILLKNMQSRALIYPVVDPTRAIVGSLVGGG